MGLKVDVSDSELDKAVQLKPDPPKGYIHYKNAESIIGFLVYVAMTYSSLMPYLKGLYLLLNSWRKNRDDEGWKLLGKRNREMLKRADVDAKPLVWVKTVPRLPDDLEALMWLTSTIQVL